MAQNFKDINCPDCQQQFNTKGRIPYIVCVNQHSSCLSCLDRIFEGKNQSVCKKCSESIKSDKITKNQFIFEVCISIEQMKQRLVKQNEEKLKKMKMNFIEVYNQREELLTKLQQQLAINHSQKIKLTHKLYETSNQTYQQTKSLNQESELLKSKIDFFQQNISKDFSEIDQTFESINKQIQQEQKSQQEQKFLQQIKDDPRKRGFMNKKQKVRQEQKMNLYNRKRQIQKKRQIQELRNQQLSQLIFDKEFQNIKFEQKEIQIPTRSVKPQYLQIQSPIFKNQKESIFFGQKSQRTLTYDPIHTKRMVDGKFNLCNNQVNRNLSFVEQNSVEQSLLNCIQSQKSFQQQPQTIKTKKPLKKSKYKNLQLYSIQHDLKQFKNIKYEPENYHQFEQLNQSNKNITTTKPFGRLENLIYVDLSYNKISRIRLVTYKKVKVFNLSFNRITQLEQLEDLQNLQNLNLAGNKLDEKVIPYFSKCIFVPTLGSFGIDFCLQKNEENDKIMIQLLGDLPWDNLVNLQYCQSRVGPTFDRWMWEFNEYMASVGDCKVKLNPL